MEPVSVNISPKDHFTSRSYNLPTKGELIRIATKKRHWAKVTGITRDEPYSHTMSCKLVYRPSPKSRLRNKGVFSKVKIEIV